MCFGVKRQSGNTGRQNDRSSAFPVLCERLSRQISSTLMERTPIDPNRSALMSRVKAKDTKPELRVRRSAHGLGYRYRLHRRDLPGSPDLVFPGRRKALFVHGCFWHRHQGCRKTTMPKTRAKFWQRKFDDNVRRDERVIAALRAGIAPESVRRPFSGTTVVTHSAHPAKAEVVSPESHQRTGVPE